MLTYIEIIAAVIGLIQGVLIMMNKRCNWIFYILQMIFLIIFSYFAKLYGDMYLDLIYIIFGIIGYITWGATESKIKTLPNKNRLLILGLIIISTIVVYYILQFTDDSLPIMDSITTVVSIFATILMVSRKLEAWILWFVGDILYCIQYLILPDMALYLFLLNVIWTALAVLSYIQWNKELKSYNKNQ